jgi:hypothetical protein
MESPSCVTCSEPVVLADGKWVNAIGDAHDDLWCTKCAGIALAEHEALKAKVKELDMLLTREFCDDAGPNMRERAEKAETALRTISYSLASQIEAIANVLENNEYEAETALEVVTKMIAGEGDAIAELVGDVLDAVGPTARS